MSHTPGPWTVAYIPTKSGLTYGLERKVSGSGIAEEMRGPSGRVLRFRTEKAAIKKAEGL